MSRLPSCGRAPSPVLPFRRWPRSVQCSQSSCSPWLFSCKKKLASTSANTSDAHISRGRWEESRSSRSGRFFSSDEDSERNECVLTFTSERRSQQRFKTPRLAMGFLTFHLDEDDEPKNECGENAVDAEGDKGMGAYVGKEPSDCRERDNKRDDETG